MTISYEIKGVVLNIDDLTKITEYYRIACTAEYLVENYGFDEDVAMQIGYDVRRKMDKHGYDEEEAIKVTLGEMKEKGEFIGKIK